MTLDEILRRLQEALPQSIVETRTEPNGMIALVVDQKTVRHLYPDTDYLDAGIDRMIEEIKRELTDDQNAW